jgi:hypothetical protein
MISARTADVPRDAARSGLRAGRDAYLLEGGLFFVAFVCLPSKALELITGGSVFGSWVAHAQSLGSTASDIGSELA